MAGRSQIIRLTVRVPRGEAGFWQIMRALDEKQGPFTVGDVEGESNVKPGAVAQYLRKLIRGGFARHVADRPAPARACKVYALVKRPKEAPRLRADGSLLGRTDRECLWCAVRNMAGAFTAREIAFAATTEHKIAVASADRYIRHLAAAGYLVQIDATHWRLKPKMNTGPLAPSILRVDAVFDRNLRKVIADKQDASEVSL